VKKLLWDLDSNMHELIKNRNRLVTPGLKTGRENAIEIVSAALRGVNARQAVQNKVRRVGDVLKIEDQSFDLRNYRNIYAIGGGKATFPLAAALEEILDERISDGFIAVKDGQGGRLNRIRVMEAAHPVPDFRSVEAGRQIFEIARKAGPEDLAICLMSGGVSSVCCYPVTDISFEDKMATSHLMVNSGADIDEIMTVRGHLSQIKLGRLAHVMHPATMINLTVSDAIGDPMKLNTDWTSPDDSESADAVRILKKFGLWNKTPEAVKRFLTQSKKPTGDRIDQTALRIHNFMVVKTTELADAAVRKARDLGLETLVLTSCLSGESREVGRFFAAIAREAHEKRRPAKPPCALIATGETAVRIENEDYGKGGRNQEFAAGACLDLKPTDPIVICSLGTDGTDGPTSVAGALTDGSTIPRASSKGMDIHEFLRRHDIYTLLRAVGDTIETHNTETNVCDIAVAVVL
jgi:glycerate-2-kinase